MTFLALLLGSKPGQADASHHAGRKEADCKVLGNCALSPLMERLQLGL